MWCVLLLLFLLVVLLYVRKSNFTDPPDKGVCYQFYTNKSGEDQADIAADTNWNEVRNNDLDIIKGLGCTCIRLYDWAWDRSHKNFFDALESRGLTTCVPVSMYNLRDPPPPNGGWPDSFTKDTWKQYLTSEFLKNGKYRPAIKYIMVANEPELAGLGSEWPTRCATIVKRILDAEKEIGVSGNLPIITVPVSSGKPDEKPPGVGYLDQLDKAFKDMGIDLGDRYVYSINFTMPPEAVQDQVISKFNKPLMITEYSPAGESLPLSPTRTNEINRFLTSALKFPNIKGVFGFQYFDPTHKDGTERGFGFTCFQKAYDVDECIKVNNCPPPDAKVGNRANMLDGVAKAYGGTVLTSKLGITCGEDPPPPPPTGKICQAKKGADPDAVVNGINYACGVLGDCSGNPCKDTDPPYGAASWVFNKYYKNDPQPSSCDFSGVAELVDTPTWPSCT